MSFLIILSCLTTAPATGCTAPLTYISSKPMSTASCKRIAETMVAKIEVPTRMQYRVRCVPAAEAI